MTDYELQQQLAQRRLQQYEQQAQTQAPQGRMVGRTFVAPNALEYIAAGLRGYGGIKGQAQAQQELQDISGQRQKAVADALRNFGKASQGQAPAQLAPEEQQAYSQMGDASQSIGGVKPNLMGAYQSLLTAPDAGLRQAGMQGMIQMPQIEAQRAEKADERAFRQSEREAVAAQRVAEMQQQHELRMEQMRQNNADRAAMAEENRRHQAEMRRIAAQYGAGAQPYFQPVQTAQGVMAFNARTGRVEPVMGPNGQPVVGAAADPALQGQITGAETTARKQAESTAEARGEVRKADMFLSQLKQAEDILKQGPTQSGVGAAADAAGRVVGFSSPGAQRAGQLEALSGWLVANVPRMEGPQSNFDVQNYMTMAGKIGDRAVPVPERLAALAEVRRLQEKYKSVGEQRLGVQPTSNLSAQDQQALDWANANPTDPRAAQIKQRLGQ